VRAVPALLLLLALPLLAEEDGKKDEKPPDPVKSLPKCLQPGAKATFTEGSLSKTFRGTVEFRAEKAEAAGTVRLVREYSATGRMKLRSRLAAVLDAKSKAILSFVYETGRDGDLSPRAKLGPDPKRPGGLLHVRFDTDKKGKTREKKTRLTPEAAWVPDLLEPFLVGLVEIGDEEPGETLLMDTETGRIDKAPARYRRLGEGVRHQTGKKDVRCLIFERKLRKTSANWYLRATDLVPVSAGGLTLKPPENGEGPDSKEPR
jgi:hypothetical protein